eukprot:Pompholyxophrys_punicea_v1_NODE_69_length_3835_cov_3.436772.p4 type:complete len:150 gc:universal NODE_69_length_3835_cov_3.436772:2149-2598(+)
MMGKHGAVTWINSLRSEKLEESENATSSPGLANGPGQVRYRESAEPGPLAPVPINVPADIVNATVVNGTVNDPAPIVVNPVPAAAVEVPTAAANVPTTADNDPPAAVDAAPGSPALKPVTRVRPYVASVVPESSKRPERNRQPPKRLNL